MIRSRPGSVVAATHNWSTPSMNAVRRAGAAPAPPGNAPPGNAGGDGRAYCGGTAGTVGGAWTAGGAWTGGVALAFDVDVT